MLSQLLSTKNTAFLPAAVITGKGFLYFDLEYLLWLRPLHTAEKHRPTMFHTATVKPRRLGPSILYNTPLMPGKLRDYSTLLPQQVSHNSCLIAHIVTNICGEFKHYI